MNKVLVDRLSECNLSADNILKEIAKSGTEQAIFVYISHLENLGTKDSDFDIYVLSENIPDAEFAREEQNCKVQIAILKGKMLDIEYWSIGYIDKLIENISKFNDSNITIEEIKLIHRLKIAEIIGGDRIGNEIKSRIQNSNLSGIVQKKYLLIANSELQDAIALYNSKEYVCALNITRIALENAIGALNAKNGITNLKNKWISKTFMNNRGYDEKLLNKYLKYQVYCNINENNLGFFVEDMIEFTQDIISSIAI